LHGGTFARAFIAFFSGKLASALALFEKLAPPEHEASVFHGNLPGRALALGHLACARWVAGDAERALEEAESSIRLAEKLQMPILLALGHVVRARLRYSNRDRLPSVEAEMQDAVRAASVDLGLLTEARIFALWAEAQRAPLALSALQPLLDTLQHRLSEVSTGSTLVGGALIEALRISGHVAEARGLTDEIIRFARAHDECIYLPELLRMRGEQLQELEPELAAQDYREAIELARSMGARSFELRARNCLAALAGVESLRPQPPCVV
jgi:tetratricopeptide (TPR) repeat protein